jgi:two-component sensor histidine kinase
LSYIDNASAREVIRESKNRVNSISLIHQKLYQTDDLSGVDLHNYIHELVDCIAGSFGTYGKIAFLLSLEHITIDVSQAVPLGLIINEALTNAVKYAFSPGQEAKINVKLFKVDEGICVQIADNGKGLPDNFNTLKSTSLGMNLMHGLSQQLGGKLILSNNGGLHLSLTFKMNNLLGIAGQEKANIKSEALI